MNELSNKESKPEQEKQAKGSEIYTCDIVKHTYRFVGNSATDFKCGPLILLALRLRDRMQKKQVVGLLCKQHDFRPRCSEKLKRALFTYHHHSQADPGACLLMARLEQHLAQH